MSPALTPASEAGAVVAPDESLVAATLAGVWKSADDSNFTREFKGDGSVIDRYAGDAAAESTGAWFVYTASTAPSGLPFVPDPQYAYVRITAGSDTYDFAVASLSATDLQLVYLERGGVLTFTKQP